MGTVIDKPAIELTPEEHTTVMSINVDSAFHCNQLAHPLLKASGNGSIVFISSVAGVLAVVSASYGTTKGTTLTLYLVSPTLLVLLNADCEPPVKCHHH